MFTINSDFDKDLDIIFGEYIDQDAITNFVQAIRQANFQGTLYIGYPVLTVDDEKIEYDAVLVSRQRGVIVFDLYSLGAEPPDDALKEVSVIQEKLYAALYNRLNSFSELRRGRNLIVEIRTASIHPLANSFAQDGDTMVVGLEKLSEFQALPTDRQLNDVGVMHLNAAIQRISNLKPRKSRDSVKEEGSKGAIIKEIEKKVANLDLWQKRGSIEYVNGPQRIRGLAGSGKTVVLALKAAYLHVKRPDWDIIITFNTRSLYQQFESLIRRFVFSQINEEPNWEKIQIMHAWGASDRTGVYKEYCSSTGIAYRDFGTASRMFGYDAAFKGACDEAIVSAKGTDLEIIDMMLIDEAQDLPASFFQIAYSMVKSPKRIVWAYDDLQNLTETQLPSARELFGLKVDGAPRVNLINEDDMPQQDIVLPRCYRNPPWTLLSAHGLGFGVHRNPMAQMFTDPSIWRRLGYIETEGTLDFDQDVSVIRSPESVPQFFLELLEPDQTLVLQKFSGSDDQYEWMCEKIKKLITDDELEASDILIIVPNVRNSKSSGTQILRTLIKHGLRGHIPGQTSSRDEIFREGSIAITHIYRAKGNEAPVVFVVNAEFCENARGIKQRRNILFTAMTRSRAWTYILGVGDKMDQIGAELAKIKEDEFSLNFHYPSWKEAQDLAVSTESISDEEVAEEFEDLRAALRKAKGNWRQLPLDIREEIENLSGGDDK